MTPLFLSEITLRDNAAARLIPRDSYGWHKVLWQFFPGQEARDFLYRVDSAPRAVRLYVVSGSPIQVPPHLPENICRCRQIPESFLSHTDYRFKLRANPTRKIKTDIRTGIRKESGMRVPITELPELVAWLKRKGEQSGFSIPHIDSWPSDSCPLELLPEGRSQFRKPGHNNAHHSSVQFAGHLHVNDAELFKTAFRKGIGSAKAFGFGLLLLQPLH